MDIAYLITVFGFGVGLLFSVRRFKADDRKLAAAIIQVERQVKRLEKYVFPPHDISDKPVLPPETKD